MNLCLSEYSKINSRRERGESHFFYCIGCKETIYQDENWKHKIKQLKSTGVNTIHIARCIEVECDDYSKHERLLVNEGFNVIKGTHK